MKKLILMIAVLAIVPIQSFFAMGQIPQEKQSQMIDVAMKVSGVMAPGYEMSGLSPKVHGPTEMQFPAADYEVSKKLENRQVVTVDFMKDATKYFSFKKFDPKTKKMETVQRPIAEVSVMLFYDTMEPVTFYPPGNDAEGISFYPNYEAFLKSHKYENGKWVEI